MSMGHDQLYMELGRVYQHLDEPDKALEALRYGCSINPKAEFFQEMSRIYGLRGDNRQAAVTLMEGLVTDPSVTVFASELVDLYTRTEPQSCALRQGNGRSSLDLACPLVHDELCEGARNVALRYANTGKRADGYATARTAVEEMGCPASLFR
jgi:lipopolysaccharide biosynthesis regulator YciM